MSGQKMEPDSKSSLSDARRKPWRSFLTDFCTSSGSLNHIFAKISLSTWFPQLSSNIRRCPYSWFYFLHKKPNECSLFYLKKSEGFIHGVNLFEIPLDCSEISLVCDARPRCQDKSCISEQSSIHISVQLSLLLWVMFKSSRLAALDPVAFLRSGCRKPFRHWYYKLTPHTVFTHLKIMICP